MYSAAANREAEAMNSASSESANEKFELAQAKSIDHSHKLIDTLRREKEERSVALLIVFFLFLNVRVSWLSSSFLAKVSSLITLVNVTDASLYIHAIVSSFPKCGHAVCKKMR